MPPRPMLKCWKNLRVGAERERERESERERERERERDRDFFTHKPCKCVPDHPRWHYGA